MGYKLAELIVEITGNAGPLGQTLSGVRSGLLGMSATGTAAAAGLGGAFATLGGASLLLSGAAVTAGIAIGSGMDRATRRASGLTETLSRVDTGFGSAASEAANRADEMARALGQARKFGGTLENLSNTVGTSLRPAFTSLIGIAHQVRTDLAGASDQGIASWSGFFGMMTRGSETVGATYQNFGDIITRTNGMIQGFMVNTWEVLASGGKVAGSVAGFIQNAMVKAFQAVVGVGLHLKTNLAAIFKEIWDSVKSGFKDPVAITLRPSIQGVKANDQSWDPPGKRNLTSSQDQTDQVVGPISGPDREAADAKAKKGAGAAVAARQNGPEPPAKTAKPARGQTSDLASYASELAGSVAGQDRDKALLDLNRQQLQIQQKQLAVAMNPPGQPGFAV